ncbi:MAG: thymidylate synthase [Paludibacteraceae bacterium]|nr:thymidylate synthase [Paludibacteraceae bacterium]
MKPTNKYYQVLADILDNGQTQTNRKGSIKYLTNQVLHLTPADLLDIFETHGIARKKLRTELQMFEAGITATEQYRAEGITWWDYCGEQLINSYPTYFRKFPALVEKIRQEMRESKNYVLFLGETGAQTNQQPCLSLVQFQIENTTDPNTEQTTGSLIVSAYQRSSDASLGLPSDIYHLYLMAREIGIPLNSITLFLANVHIYETNLLNTFRLLNGEKDIKFVLNV